MAAQVVALVCLSLVGHIESVDLFKVLSVTLSQSRQFVVSLTFLALKTSVGVIRDSLLMLNSLNVDVSL